MSSQKMPPLLNGSPTTEPLATGPSLRTVSLPKDEYDKQVGGGLWRISISARAGGAGTGAGGSPECVVPLCPGSPGRSLGRRNSPNVPPQRPDPPRSILGLPIISCRNRRYALWVLGVLMVDLTYSAFLLPLSIGFQVNDLQWTWACFVDLAAGLVFAAELLLGFHVSYLAANCGQQHEVHGGRAVARYYIRHGSFWQDALSTAIWVTQIVLLLVCQAGGVQVDESGSAFQIVRIVRMIRFFSVIHQLCILTIGSGSGSLIPSLSFGPRLAHTLNVTYSSFVVLHFAACLWNFMAIKQGFSNTWMNPIASLVRRYSADGASVLTPQELAGVPAAERYVMGVYFSLVTMATLGYGDIVPTNPLEYLVDCVIVALGVLMFGLALGSLAELMARSSKEARQAQMYREKMDGVNAWLHASSIPRPLKHKIRAYYSDVWLRHVASQHSVVEQFQELPHALRQEVAWEQNRRLLTRLPLFRELDDTQRFALSSMLLPVDLTPGQELCLHGDPADRFWLLHEGEVQVFDECAIVSIISAPAVLGVEALLQHVDMACSARPYGYRTATACTVWEAQLEDLMPYLLENVSVLDKLCSRAQEQREAQHEAQDWLGQSVGVAVGGTSADSGPADAASAGAGGEQQPDAQQQLEMGQGEQAAWPQDSFGMQSPFAGLATNMWTISTDSIAHEVAPRFSAVAEQPLEEPDVFLPAARGTDAETAASRGEVFQLRQEVVHRLDALGAEMRQAVAAASLAQCVAAQHSYGSRSHGHAIAGGSGRGMVRRAESVVRLQRRQWTYGHLSPQ